MGHTRDNLAHGRQYPLCHTLIILAAEPAGLLTSQEIAERLDANPVVVRRVLSLLQQAGLIDTQKGPSGGSKLARPAKEIGLGEVYKALEPSTLFHIAPAQAAKLNTNLEKIFAEAQTALEANLDEMNIGQLAKKLAKGKK